jgi:hypothetical protein
MQNVQEPVSSQPESVPVLWRNMFSAINLLRLLQKLTKGKAFRVKTLAQYKAPVRLHPPLPSKKNQSCLIRCGQVIMKRLLRIEHPVLRLYTLKVLKSQVRYLGRKWRQGAVPVVRASAQH